MNINSVKQSAKRLGFVYRWMHGAYGCWLGIKKRIRLYRHRERRCSYGKENPDKTFYVIGVTHTTGGLFAIVKSVFCHIYYAVQKGYIPVVDMLNFKSQLSDNGAEVNAWELYFEQPAGYTLEDIRNSKNIILSRSLPFPPGVEIGFDTEINASFYKQYHDVYTKYIRPCKAVRVYAEKKYSSIITDRSNTLGVLCRGTDYIENRPSGHPIQPSKEQAVAKAWMLMSKHEYRYIFLATEDQNFYNYFKQEFGDRLLFSGQKLYDGMNGRRFLSEIPVASYSEKWHNTVDYFSTIYILSKCDSLVAGLTCGSICDYLMSEGYKDVHIWDLGRYE